MRKSAGLICGLAAAFGLLTLTTLPSAKADKPVAIEKEFLGIRMLQTYRQVLARYGAPAYIFRNGETLQLLEARNLKGELTGGILGIDNGGGSTALTAAAARDNSPADLPPAGAAAESRRSMPSLRGREPGEEVRRAAARQGLAAALPSRAALQARAAAARP